MVLGLELGHFKNDQDPFLLTQPTAFKRWTHIKGGVALGIVIIVMVIGIFYLSPADARDTSPNLVDSLISSSRNITLIQSCNFLNHVATASVWQDNQVCKSLTYDKGWNFDLETLPLVIKDLTSTTNAKLIQRFERMETLGGGSYGKVVKVKEKQLGQFYAMKVFNPTRPDSYYKSAESAISYILNTAITPHLTRPYESLAISSSSDEYLSQNPRDFLVDGAQYRKSVLISELLESDLHRNYMFFSQKQLITFELQNLHVTSSLKNIFNIEVQDNLLKNRFFITLSKDHYFRGYKLIEFDYWKYRIYGIDFYIPRPRHLLKLGDYDEWQIPDPLLLNSEPQTVECPVSLELFAFKFLSDENSALYRSTTSYEDLFSTITEWIKEPENATVLDISTNNF